MADNPRHPVSPLWSGLTKTLPDRLHQTWNLILPALCQLCENPASPHHAHVLCDACVQDFTPLPEGCPICCQPGAHHPPRCVRCDASPPHFDRAFALTLYEGIPRKALLRLKSDVGQPLGAALGNLLVQRFGPFLAQQGYDAVVPVPVHWRRQFRRGFNQSELIGAPVATWLIIPMLHLLTKYRATTKQSTLGEHQRQHNLEGAFHIVEKYIPHVRGARLLLVDDVMTTGATADACAIVLKSAAATQVDLLCIARTP